MRFKWRPRPPAHLSEQKIKEIRRNIKITSQRFEEEDRREQQKLSKELLEKRTEILDKFNKLRAEHAERYKDEREERLQLRSEFIGVV
jgi:uncharacterized protein with WD repeat